MLPDLIEWMTDSSESKVINCLGLPRVERKRTDRAIWSSLTDSLISPFAIWFRMARRSDDKFSSPIQSSTFAFIAFSISYSSSVFPLIQQPHDPRIIPDHVLLSIIFWVSRERAGVKSKTEPWLTDWMTALIHLLSEISINSFQKAKVVFRV